MNKLLSESLYYQNKNRFYELRSESFDYRKAYIGQYNSVGWSFSATGINIG
jgi:hypothetical protein